MDHGILAHSSAQHGTDRGDEPFPISEELPWQRMGEGANAVPCAAASLLKYTAWAVCRQFPKPFISQEVHDERQHELIGKI